MTDGAVLFFLPALDEGEAIAGVLARIPAEVAGHRIVTLVVDDGSRDGTAAVARAWGAEVLSFPRHRGLGAAVRCGLACGAAMSAAAVVFCDADQEYDPAEVMRLVAPVLAGEADYVVGSRFAGGPRRMSPYRSLGNRASRWSCVDSPVWRSPTARPGIGRSRVRPPPTPR
ncbi:MAG: glycosyltransferase family 2 protein [Acidimicrobiales bacterium]